MPRKKPLEPIRQHYSQDLKQQVIYQAFTLGKKSVEIAVDLNMPLRSVLFNASNGHGLRSERFVGTDLPLGGTHYCLQCRQM